MRTANKLKPSSKSDKVQLRLHQRQKSVIARAAELRQTSLSNFMVEHAYEAAQKVLAEQSMFVLTPEGWSQFCAALDAPVREIPSLRTLLNEPGFFNASDSSSNRTREVS